MNDATPDAGLDPYTQELFDDLFSSAEDTPTHDDETVKQLTDDIQALARTARTEPLTAPITSLFKALKQIRATHHLSPQQVGITRQEALALARRHEQIDEHGVTIGGRIHRAMPLVRDADARVRDYLDRASTEAPSGVALWETLSGNARRIQSLLGMSKDDWDTYAGQLRNCIDSVAVLAKIVDLPEHVIAEVTRVTGQYRMRLTPYYASLIRSGCRNDPVLLQSVPTGEMVDAVGEEIPPVAADHSPARLIDQFYPRVVTIKATNMCAMYCTHCLRIAHIGKKDRIYSESAYREALDYVRGNPLIRDVLITGGDAFALPNKIIRRLLAELDTIDHIRIKRMGTRIPVTAPMRVDSELLDILAHSNEQKPLRVVTQINTAQEITPVSRDAFRRISGSVSAVLNQAVLLKGINDSQVKMWKLCETIQESYVRPYYIFNCSYRNPQFAHLRVPVETGRDIVESMYGNISGDAIPRYIATAGGKIPLHRSNVLGVDERGAILMKKPWGGDTVRYPDADPEAYADTRFGFEKS